MITIAIVKTSRWISRNLIRVHRNWNCKDKKTPHRRRHGNCGILQDLVFVVWIGIFELWTRTPRLPRNRTDPFPWHRTASISHARKGTLDWLIYCLWNYGAAMQWTKRDELRDIGYPILNIRNEGGAGKGCSFLIWLKHVIYLCI